MLGERIRRRHQELDLSLRALDGEIGVTASFLSQIERNQASPSIETLRKIAHRLDVPIFQLLLEKQDRDPVVGQSE